MDEDSDVFQDFGSDASDFDDDVDLDFTDGESASILQLMGGADSIKKTNSGGMAATPLSEVVHDIPIASNVSKSDDRITTASVTKASARGFSDEELLDELFPKPKAEITTNSGEPTEQHIEDAHSFSKECEVEWALMGLKEHEQLGRPPVSAVTGDTDFLSLFEEMYGDNTAISLSTPSSPDKRDGGRQDNLNVKQLDENQAADISDVSYSPKVTGGIDALLPAEIRDILQSVYTRAIETHWDLSEQLSEACSTLYIPDHTNRPDPIGSLDSLVRATCSLEESLNSQDFVKSVASTREERLELILVALDNKIGALPHSSKIKWAKIIDMLPLLVKMREQTKPSVPTPSPTTEQSVLQIKTMASPPAKPKDKGSPLQGWATFHPEKMPARRCESMKITTSRLKQGGQGTSSKKPRVRIREYLPTKLRVRCKVYNPEDSELTFRPKINKKRLHHRKSEPEEQEESFAARMERDISLRRLQKLQQDQKREQHEQEAENVTGNLIAKGSQRILLKNGMWTETLEERLHRLAKHRTNIESGDSRSKKRLQRHEQRKREAAAIASRACESLYQRGIEQRRREQERLQEDTLDLEFQRNRPKISNRSVRVMKTRIRQELAQLCLDSQHTASTETSHEDDESRHNDSPTVTFVQFSCALLYFGFVTNLNTPWKGSASDNSDNEITLLWHSWTVFTRDESGTPGSKLAMKVLERILFSVILGGRAGDHPVLRCRDVQVLLRLFRANYYTRKHTQLKEEPSGGHRQNTSNAKLQHSRERQTNKRGFSHRQRVRYSMHGKPIRNNEAPETDLLSEREHLLREKIEQMREAKAKQELEGCTFHPRINPRPSEAAAWRSSPPKPDSSSFDTMSTFERLYSDAFQRQNNVLEKYLEAKLHREELEKRENKVQPSYVNGLTIEERLENLHVALAGNALPVNFHKKIDAMRTATEMKALNEQIKEQRLQPAQFKKAKDGRTIVLPFQFATEIRAAMSADLKKQRTNTASRPRDHVMNGLRPLEEKREREELTQPLARNEDNDHNGKGADLCVDVHLSPSETHQLYLNVNDDPCEAVERFAQRFSLTNTQRHFLAQLVKARLEQFATY